MQLMPNSNECCPFNSLVIKISSQKVVTNMPRKAVRDRTDIFNALSGLPIFNADGTLKKKEHDENGYKVWYEASKLLKPMTEQNIYISVLNNRKNGLKTDLEKYHFPQFVSVTEPQEPQLCDTKEIDLDESDEIRNFKECHSDKPLPSDSQKIVEENSALPDDYECLMRMQLNVLYHSIIEKIRARPFSITLKSPEHSDMFKQLVNANMSIGITAIKAAAPQIRIKNYSSQTNHLISLVSRVEKQPIIMCQFISENIKFSDIKYFILDFLKDEVMNLPVQFHVEYQVDLIENICLAFNICTLPEYSMQILHQLQNKSDSLPPVLLNVDLFSILMKIDDSKHLNNLTVTARRFYMKSLISLRFIHTLTEFDHTVGAILTCLFSPYTNVVVDDATKFLDNQVRNNEVERMYQMFLELKGSTITHSMFGNDETMDNRHVLQYIQDLEKKVVIQTDHPNLVPNPYACPEWYDGQLKILLSLFPLWTGLVSDGQNVAFVSEMTSLQKQLSCDNSNFIRFLSDTIMHSKESMRNGKSILKNRKKLNVKPVKMNKTTASQVLLKCEENWRGKNECYKAAQKSVMETVENIADAKYSPVNEDFAMKNLDVEVVHQTIDTKHSTVDDDFDIEKLDIVVVDETTNAKCSPVHGDFSVENLDLICIDQKSNIQHGNDETDLSLKTERIKVNEELISTPPYLLNDMATSDCETPGDCSASSTNNSLQFHEKSFDSSKNALLDHNYSFSPDTSLALYQQTDNNLPNPFSTHEVIPNSYNTIADGDVKENAASSTDQHKSASTIRKNNIKEEASTRRDKAGCQFVRINIDSSKYFVAAPSMELAHSQIATYRGKELIIKNAIKLAAKSIMSTKFTIEDSSKIDVFIEILSFAFKNYMYFQECCSLDKMCTVKCNDDCFLQMIKKYCRTGKITNLYNGRADFMYKYADVNEYTGVIKIDDRIGEFFKKIMTFHYSFIALISCSVCDNLIKSISEPVITLKIFPSESLSDLQSLLNLYFQTEWCSTEHKCQECSKNSVENIIYFDWNPYLCIDIEESNVEDFVNSAPQYIQVPISQGQEKVIYALAGVVTPDSKSNPMYVAYCQTVQHWDRRSGLSNKIKKVAKLPKTKIVILFYIKIRNN